MRSWTDYDAGMDASSIRVFAEDAEYRLSCTGDAQYIRAILSEDTQRLGDGGYVDIRTEIQVRKIDLLEPRKGDCITIGGITWIIDDIEPAQLRWVLVVRRMA